MPKFKHLKIISWYVLILITGIIINSCENQSEIVSSENNNNTTNQPDTSRITGQVISYLTGVPIDSANVLISGGPENLLLTTNTQGKFDISFELNQNLNLTIITIKEGYISDTTTVFVTAGTTLKVPTIELVVENTGVTPSGDPVSISLLSQTSESIGVKESGSEETAQIIYVVKDSAGVPIDLAHSVDVHFRFGSAPGGGEILSPAVTKTNNYGEAVVNLTSGTKSGVVQIIAEIFLENKTIKSLPVNIAIHGGLPDDNHFSIAPSVLNFPGYNIYGLTDAISAFVGDKYGNPVREGTSVYFTTTGGIIGGSATTDLMGVGTVDLMSSAPQPNHPVWGPGFATITANTADENQNTLIKETLVLFSGIPQISVSPTSIDIPNGGSQSFAYVVSDQNSNPLAGGTGITVTAEGEDVGVQGDNSITLPDTQNRGWTQFGFTVFDTNDSTNVAKSVTVKIQTQGPNGGGNLTISGTKR